MKKELYKTDKEYYIYCPTMIAFEQNVIDGGWESIQDFEQQTGVTAEELIGKWFLVVNGRVFLREEQIAKQRRYDLIALAIGFSLALILAVIMATK